MYNYYNKKKLLLSILLILILAIGIGYAYLTSNLSISGNTSVSTNTWNIHFENIQVKEGSVTATTSPTLSNSNTSITYTIDLNRPKEYYEFTVDVKNDGTLPGKVSISTLSGITTEAQSIIDYSVSYTNGRTVAIGDILNAGAKKSIKVRTFYKDEINPTDFPATDLNLTLTYTLQYVQSEEDEFDTNALIEQLKEENSSCIYQYTGAVTDEVGNTETVTAATSNVYFNRCADKRNIKFAGYCWQMIRTTETGGIKMIYNGEPDNNGECGSSRGDHKGIVGVTGSTQTLNAEYLYGTTFTYNITTSEFTLVDTTTATWSNSTYQNLLGKFTCKNTSGTCTTLYSVNGYSNATTAYTSSYTIGDTNFAQIGTSSFNANYRSLAMVGYMFNKVYNYAGSSAPTSGSLMGNDVLYSNGTYTLLPADGESELGTTKDDTHHYTCNTTSSTCNKVRYYNFNNYYIELDGVANIDAAVNEMLYNDNVNTYNSSIKGIIDSWYAQNLSVKTNMLEDTVYCNARNMINQSENGWNKDGRLTTYTYFKNNTLNNDISCASVTDQFAVSNNKAKLTYPVSLATHEELYTLTNNNSSAYYDVLTKTDVWWWGLSPFSFFSSDSYVRYVSSSGSVGVNNPVVNRGGIRPVISLASSSVISSGDGSATNPWVIQE